MYLSYQALVRESVQGGTADCKRTPTALSDASLLDMGSGKWWLQTDLLQSHLIMCDLGSVGSEFQPEINEMMQTVRLKGWTSTGYLSVFYTVNYESMLSIQFCLYGTKSPQHSPQVMGVRFFFRHYCRLELSAYFMMIFRVMFNTEVNPKCSHFMSPKKFRFKIHEKLKGVLYWVN